MLFQLPQQPGQAYWNLFFFSLKGKKVRPLGKCLVAVSKENYHLLFVLVKSYMQVVAIVSHNLIETEDSFIFL